MGSIQKNQDNVYSRMKNLNSSLNYVMKNLQSFYDHNVTGELDSALLFTYSCCMAHHLSNTIFVIETEHKLYNNHFSLQTHSQMLHRYSLNSLFMWCTTLTKVI